MTNPSIITEGTTGEMGTVSVSAPKLRRMLSAVLPHAGRDDTLPALMAVKFEVTAGVLYLAATDRYTLAVAREPIPGAAKSTVPDAEFSLPAEAPRELRRLLKGATDVAALAVADGRLSVVIGHGAGGSWPVDAKWTFPKWRPMVHRMITAPACELGDGFGLDSRMLRRFTAARQPSWAEPVSIRIVNNGTAEKINPLLMVTRGDWFAGFQMPVRHVVRESDASHAQELWAAATAPAGKAEAA